MRGIVVVPTYNERDNLRDLIARVWMHCPELDVLVVDDNSPDGTGILADEIAEEHPGRVRVLHRAAKEGLGRAYVDGIRTVLELDYHFLVHMDADHSHNPAHIPAMIAALDNCDLVVGSRYRNGTISVVGWDLKRLILSKFATAYVNVITRMDLSDATSGFRCWRVAALRDLGLEGLSSTGYLILVEMAYWARRRGLRIAEVSITFEERRFGASKISNSVIRESVVGVFLLARRYRKQNRGLSPAALPKTAPSGHSGWRQPKTVEIVTFLYLFVASLAFWFFGIQAAEKKLLSFDDIFSLTVASLGDTTTVVRALLQHADNLPPLDCIFRNWSVRLVSVNELGSRLSSLAGVYVAILSVFFATRRATSTLGGAAASTALVLSFAFESAIGGRVYGVLLGICALAYFTWSKLARTGFESWRLWLLTGTLCGLALCCHYYACLFVLSMGVASLAAFLAEGRFPKASLAWLAAVALVGGLSAPFMLSAGQYKAVFWTTTPSALSSLRQGFDPAFPSLGLLLLVACIVMLTRRTKSAVNSGLQEPSADRNLSFGEVVLCVLLLTTPFQQFLLATFITNAWQLKYSIYCVIGGSVLAGTGISRLMEGSRNRRRIMVATCAVVTVLSCRALRNAAPPKSTPVQLADSVQRTAATLPDLPLLAPSSHEFLILRHYGGPVLRQSMTLLVDEDSQMRMDGYATDVLALRNLSPFVQLNVQQYESFVRTHRRFGIIRTFDTTNPWLSRKLAQDGYRLIHNPEAGKDGIEWIVEAPGT